jgi:putative nucleotidyltransferase with HDIG domain
MEKDLDLDWISVSIDELRQLARELPLDLFLKLGSSKYCQIFSSQTGLDYDRLASYRRKGVTHLYARRSDQDRLRDHLFRQRIDRLLLDPALRPEKRAALVLNWTERTLAEVFADFPLKSEAVEESRSLVMTFVELMSVQPISLAALLRLVSYHEYLHYHSVAVSVFSAILARSLGKYSEEDLLLIAWGGFLHDIGASRMEGDFFCDPLGQAWGAERQQRDEHTRIGLEIVQECPVIPGEVGFMVYQHHERPDGSGGPNRLDRSRIHETANLISVVDAWSSLLSRSGEREALPPREAFQVLLKAAEQDRIDGDLVLALKRLIVT